jgi:hypothetical protein
MSTTKKIAAETDRAHRLKVATTIGVRDPKRPKLQKIRASQKTRTTNNGGETEFIPVGT